MPVSNIRTFNKGDAVLDLAAKNRSVSRQIWPISTSKSIVPGGRLWTSFGGAPDSNSSKWRRRSLGSSRQ